MSLLCGPPVGGLTEVLLCTAGVTDILRSLRYVFRPA